MSTLPVVFKSKSDLLDFANDFLVKYILPSLDNDVKICLSLPYTNTVAPTNAYVPAFLYCFAIIDLLSSLHSGNAKSGKNSENSRKYMTEFMKYTKENAFLLQKIYRHKMVHLGMPKIGILHGDKIISWSLHDTNPGNHLTIDYSDIDDIPIGKVAKLTNSIRARVEYCKD